MREIKYKSLMQAADISPVWVYFGTEGKPSLQANSRWISPDLQYTSRQDSSGNDIYEGDVIQANFVGRQKAVAEVKWSSGQLTYVVSYDGGELPLKDLVASTVVGNAYELNGKGQ